MTELSSATRANASAPTTHVRFITAASLFDGHDASINIMRRILQTLGAEVIHLGHNRSVQEIVRTALQEDAHAIAISSYQGGHVEFFKYTVDLLREAGASHIRVFGGGGGTITPTEIEELHKYGVTRLYSPEDGRLLGLEGLIRDMISRTQAHIPSPYQASDLEGFRTDERALARVLTTVEFAATASGIVSESARTILTSLDRDVSAPGKSIVVGLTGTGGAGKSSLTDELILRALESDGEARVAVLAVDPTRRKTGGALLGDRLRMNSVGHPRAYMRSLATRNVDASISAAVAKSVQVLKEAGYRWIFVETGGIGQAETSIVDIADINVYVMTAEFGAPTQLEKINMLDYADLVVINKIDKIGALDALNDVRRQFRRNHREFEKQPADHYPVFATVASRFADPGVDRVFSHLAYLATQTKKRCATASSVPIPDALSVTIVPRNRSAYLSEVATSVREYHAETERDAKQLIDIGALDHAATLPLSESTRNELKSQGDAARGKLDRAVLEQVEAFENLVRRYSGDQFKFTVRDKELSLPLNTQSLSGNKIPKVAVPKFHSAEATYRFLRRENLPGYFPYTAGVFPFKRTEEDPKRQFAGEGPPERTNRRFHLLCDDEKAKRLSTAFDSVTLYGEDPDERPDIFGKIGESGVNICTLDDAKRLYDGFDLCDENTSVSMTINGPAPMLLAFFFNTAIDQQVDQFRNANKREPSPAERSEIQNRTLQKVRGTVQADILKEDQAQNTCIFSTEFALRMMGDIQQYFIDHQIRNYYSVSISGYHIAEAGANPISQLAFTLANGFTFVEYYRARGMDIDAFVPNFSFFFSNGLDAEYTVIGRVARRIWAIAMQRLYGASERSQKLKYHIQTSGRSLHAQEISFNDIRTTLQALIAYFDHCNSLHTNAYDEAVTTPTEESVRRAMAIQMIISKELGWAKNENPLQGSFLIDELTDLVEQAVLAEFDRISARGGVLGAMETHYQRSKIQEESLFYEQLKHSGELPIVGVNTYLNPNAKLEDSFSSGLVRATYEEKSRQIQRLREFQKNNRAAAQTALADLQETARRGDNVFAALMRAARVCSLGQMTQALYQIGGKYRRNV